MTCGRSSGEWNTDDAVVLRGRKGRWHCQKNERRRREKRREKGESNESEGEGVGPCQSRERRAAREVEAVERRLEKAFDEPHLGKPSKSQATKHFAALLPIFSCGIPCDHATDSCHSLLGCNVEERTSVIMSTSTDNRKSTLGSPVEVTTPSLARMEVTDESQLPLS